MSEPGHLGSEFWHHPPEARAAGPSGIMGMPFI